MNTIKSTIFFVIIAIAIVCSCGRTNRYNGIHDTIVAMQANRLQLSLSRMARCIPDNDSARADTMKAAYRLVVYVDSTNCSPCVLDKMHQWNRLIDKTRMQGSHVNYVFIFEPKSEQIEDAHFAVESSGLKNRIYLDTAYIFRKDNKFIPKDRKYHTMLVDEKDSIVLIGDPKANKNIERIFLNIINKH